MLNIADLSDARLRNLCIYCNAFLDISNISREHVPGKIFLDSPYPKNLFIVKACKACNHSFSRDEEYSAVILGVMMARSAEPEKQVWLNAKKILSHHDKMREQVRKGIQNNVSEAIFKIEFNSERLNNIIIKNAKAIALYVLSEPLYDDPSEIRWKILHHLSPEDRRKYECITSTDIFPEVGSRMMHHIVEDIELNQWIEIQRGTFRFAVVLGGSIIVKMVFREFLFAEVIWRD